jgi:hypothetical protein
MKMHEVLLAFSHQQAQQPPPPAGKLINKAPAILATAGVQYTLLPKPLHTTQ